VDAHLLTAWNGDPTLLAGLGLLLVSYWVGAVRDRQGGEVGPSWRAACYLGGVAVLALALLSPLDLLADRYLFSAHMLQHILLLLVVPPLILAGLPSSLAGLLEEVLMRWRCTRLFASPLVAFVLYAVLTWLWHLPLFYEAALRSEALHAVEHLCFLLSAGLFWVPICRPIGSLRLPALVQIVYIFGAGVSSTALAALITFAAHVLYPTYAQDGPSAVVRTALGLTPLADQQLGGLLMWIGGAFWFLGAAAVVFYRWFERAAREEITVIDDGRDGEVRNPVSDGVSW
jgi:cytochrome c oxidase assembly factor CtaG